MLLFKRICILMYKHLYMLDMQNLLSITIFVIMQSRKVWSLMQPPVTVVFWNAVDNVSWYGSFYYAVHHICAIKHDLLQLVEVEVIKNACRDPHQSYNIGFGGTVTTLPPSLTSLPFCWTTVLLYYKKMWSDNVTHTKICGEDKRTNTPRI